MSDTDAQEPVAANEDTVEFIQNHFDEPVETPVEEAKPEAPSEPSDAAPTETPEDPDSPAEDGDPEVPAEETPEQSVEEKSEPELKGMTRAERKEYFESLKAEQQREVGEVIDQNYQPTPFDELKNAYLNEGYDEFQAEMLADRDITKQEKAIAEAKNDIIELNANLRVDSLEAQNTFDWMNPKSDIYDKDLHQMAADLFAQGMQVDPRTNQIVDARMTPMQAAQIIDKARNSGMAKAQVKAQKAAEAQLAAAAPQTSTAPPASQSEEDRQASSLERALNDAK